MPNTFWSLQCCNRRMGFGNVVRRRSSDGYLDNKTFHLHVNRSFFPFHCLHNKSIRKRKIQKTFPHFSSFEATIKERKENTRNPRDTENKTVVITFRSQFFFCILAIRRISNNAYYLCIFTKRFSLGNETEEIFQQYVNHFVFPAFHTRATKRHKKLLLQGLLLSFFRRYLTSNSQS